MNVLFLGTDRAILDSESDVRSRLMIYVPLMNEMHIHCTSINVPINGERISENVWLYSVQSWWKSVSLLRKIMREKNIDVIVSPDPFGKAWIAMILAFVYRKKLLLSVYGGNIFDRHWKKLSIFNRIYTWLGRIVFSYADAIQTDGLETYDVLKQKYGQKVFWKPMVPTNINELFAINREDQIGNIKPNILYVGRLIEQKNIPFLTRVINELKDKVTFTVVGEGPLKDLLPIHDISYVSTQNRNEMVERFKEADIFILTSYFEGFARVIMEAAAAGLPIITTQVSGTKNIVDDSYIFEQGSEKGFIEAIQVLVHDSMKRIKVGIDNRERARSMLSIDTMIEQQKKIFDYLK